MSAYYKDVKNLIHNEIGMSKEELLDVFKQIAREDLRGLTSEKSTFIKECIKEVVKDEMFKVISKEDYPKLSHHFMIYHKDKENLFQEFVAQVIKEEIVNNLEKQFSISINLEKNKES